MYIWGVKRGLKYVASGFLVWILILAVNWVSYTISDNAIKLRGDLSLSLNQADLPFSGLESNESKCISFSQRSFSENKQQDFHLTHFAFSFKSFVLLSNRDSNFSTEGFLIFITSPFDLLTHQFLI